MKSRNRVLVVDDESLICWSLSKMLERAGYEVDTANSGSEAREKFESFNPDMAILDICLPDVDGLDLLREFKALDEDLLVLMITAEALSESVFRAFKLGAEDYIGKPFNLDAVEEVVQRAFEKRKLVKRANTFHKQLRKKFDYDQLVGTSPEMIELFKMIGVCSASDCKTVLILGESGTGKELVARAIHKQSARSDSPFIDVNCASIPENLFENEFFGHERGAYTDAGNREQGVFEQAEGGTLFLDEIGDMPLATQAKILKVIETKKLRRLGGKDDVEVDVRIVAATNQNLLKMVEDGTFRGDLYYRLNMMSLNLVPLRDRKQCIPSIVNYFIERLNDEYGRTIKGISEGALETVMAYDWPGNVRELRNAIERAMMLEQGAELSPACFCLESRGKCAEQVAGPTAAATEPAEPARTEDGHVAVVLPPEGISIEEIEKQYIQQALGRYNGNQTKAAKCLGISFDTLRYRRKKFGLEDWPPKKDSANEKKSGIDELEPISSRRARSHEPRETQAKNGYA
ncbi:DNA-binding transcriptional response regulator, NtrC family, contains REC, AAA-type ATPase, and a Fis-type DNA-binding domains [Malonomonas rubra DSM 5091]|uniref:DNA-binding transcriptional response regulator, NtrC family, contains REC, AAA-type ATPase, and a Fis-type DNA-binding domains n=1 Tax=Malonomonas rubra DSM 5091 TaxID=1122189 RepID=A0A1M6DVG8_MALRU|nr:sigma-54 dependent transcriptional regulator [Malonomonas rubra]SHI77221.1 DNA-binding transcriptional response regulator, NtrC family, contains REC, AAA-type ATPase, and a Fis-type DNA-binding domains [Malonomonas rubra DSM 5091]